MDFTPNDQSIVNEMREYLLAGNPTFLQVGDASPRHCLAATMFAFEKNLQAADVINRTFKHFV